MFLKNKYTTWYHNIISNRKSQPITGYTEKHHIMPKSLGGNNDADNIVSLTAREHFLVHWLLTKMCQGEAKKKMYFAMYALSWSRKNSGRIITSWQYEKAKKAQSLGMKGHNNPIHKRDITSENNPFWGKKHTQETKNRISKTKKEYFIANPEMREKQSIAIKGKFSGENHPFYGSIGATKGKSWKVKETMCPHCNKIGGSNTMKRWHFDNCKVKVDPESEALGHDR